jgi:hypothetical protein
MPMQIQPNAANFPYWIILFCKKVYKLSFKLPLFAVATFATPESSLLPNMRSIKGTNILRENKLKTIERDINRVYRLM